jgi:tetratricopeptide (TPR) repeat protein
LRRATAAGKHRFVHTTAVRSYRAAAVFTAMLVATGCIFARPAEPPSPADPELTARVGLVVATNSRSFDRLLDARPTRGVVVLFVQPKGPADGSGIERGDLITAIDGQATSNAERAVAQLRSRPGQTRRLDVTKRSGQRRRIRIQARIPGKVNLRKLYRRDVDRHPDDPVLRFLLAQAYRSQGNYGRAITQVDEALTRDRRFADALTLRAEIGWDVAREAEAGSATRRSTIARVALQDWANAIKLDRSNTRAMVGRGQALSEIGQDKAAVRLAKRAIEIDDQLPGAQYLLALAEFNQKHYRQAVGPGKRAIELNAYDVRYYELLATAYKRLKRTDDCIKTVQAIVDLLPGAREKATLLRTCR